MNATHGIRKISERVLAPGRAIIVTEKDKDKYTWGDIPNGSLFIDSQTGIMAVKLEGQSDWVPAGLRNDGTINIAKDNIAKVESFTIIQESVTTNPDEFIYSNSEGERRIGVKEWNESKTVLKGYIFQLEHGTYIMGRNHLKVTIDDVLHRSVATGGVEEISESRFRMTEKLEDKMEITVEYNSAFRMGAPYPRFFMNKAVPEASETGDFWLDTDASMDELSPVGDEEDDRKISWGRIENHPTSLSGYGITDPVAKQGHTHTIEDIVQFPKSMPANGGWADTAVKALTADSAKYADTTNAATCAINDQYNRNIAATYMTKDGAGAKGTWDIDIRGHADSARKADLDGFGRDIASTYLTNTGFSMNGPINFVNSTWNTMGDDSYIGDFNRAGLMGIKGKNGVTGIGLVRRNSTNNSDYATITYDGGALVFNKTLQANITGTAGMANGVEWNNVRNKPSGYRASGGNADSAGYARSLSNDSANMYMHWSGKSGQPTWLWGGNDAANMYVYNPRNFNVAHADSASNADKVAGHSVGTGVNQVALLDGSGKLSAKNMPAHKHSVSDLTGTHTLNVYASTSAPAPDEGVVWFDLTSMTIKVYHNRAWQTFGAAYR